MCTKPLRALYTPLPLHPPQIKLPRTSHGHGFFFQLKRTYEKTKNAHLRETKKQDEKKSEKAKQATKRK